VSNSEIRFIPYEQAYEAGFEDMHRRLPDISKIQRLNGYEPTLNLEDILGRIVAFERNQLAPVQR
jgi:UDP-glucose 4-epimerase